MSYIVSTSILGIQTFVTRFELRRRIVSQSGRALLFMTHLFNTYETPATRDSPRPYSRLASSRRPLEPRLVASADDGSGPVASTGSMSTSEATHRGCRCCPTPLLLPLLLLSAAARAHVFAPRLCPSSTSGAVGGRPDARASSTACARMAWAPACRSPGRCRRRRRGAPRSRRARERQRRRRTAPLEG